MNNIIEFSARGTNFSLPKKLLDKYPETMLSMLDSNVDIPIDKIDDNIYVDINPNSIGPIIDYYNLGKCEVEDFYTLMDFRYLGLENITNNLPYSSKESCKKNDVIVSNNGELNTDISKYKYCRIHTADCKIIIISIMSYDINNLDVLSSMLLITENNSDTTDTYVDAWIGMSERIVNIILSIIRDGIISYYRYLTYDHLHNRNIILDEYQKISDSVFFDIDVDEKDIGDIDKYACGCHRTGMYTMPEFIFDNNCEDCNYKYNKKIEELKKRCMPCAYDGDGNICKNDDVSVQIQFNSMVVNNLEDLTETLDINQKKTKTNFDNIYKFIENIQNKIINVSENRKIIEYLKLYKLC